MRRNILITHQIASLGHMDPVVFKTPRDAADYIKQHNLLVIEWNKTHPAGTATSLQLYETDSNPGKYADAKDLTKYKLSQQLSNRIRQELT